ncbi:hypothetical protein BsWGS_00934 [Bradybaena similaris]
MPWGAMRHYGRKIVVSEVAFDQAVSDEAKENRRNSLFGSSDSSHTSSLNSSVSLFMDRAPQKPQGRHAQNKKKQSSLQPENKYKNKRKKNNDSVKELTVSMTVSNSENSSLYHEECMSMCTPIKVKRKRKALLEINSQPSTTQTKPARQAKPVKRQKNNKSSMARFADSGELTENLPDFDAIEQDDLIIASTPSGPQQSSNARLRQDDSIFRSHELNVSHISLFDNSETGNSPLRDSSEKNHCNITFRNHRKMAKGQKKKLGDKNAPNSRDLLDSDADSSSLYELANTSRLCDENTSTNSSIISDTSWSNNDSSLASVSLRTCSVEDLSHSFRVMHLRSRDITQRLRHSSQMSRSRNLPDLDDDLIGSQLSVTPDLFQESSLSVDKDSPALPQITEEDSYVSQYLEDEVESESDEDESESDEDESEGDKDESESYDEGAEDGTDDHSDEEESESDVGSEGNDEVAEENNEVEEENYNEEDEIKVANKKIDGSLGEDDEDGLMQEQHDSSKSNVTLYELVSSMSFSEKLSNSSLCKHVTVSASQRVLTLCGQTEPVIFSECIPPKMMSRCVKIGEGVYGEVFRSWSHGEAVALKIIPIEGDQHVNDCPQKKFHEILPEIVIAKELSDLASCSSNQTSNFCQVNRVSCVKGMFPGELLEQWDAYSQQKVSENDRPDMFGDDQLFVVFEFIDGGSPLENYKFVNYWEALSALHQVVCALAVAESQLEFEHRDLHIGNVLVRPCQEDTISFVLCGREYSFPSAGVKATIIDFTISRLHKDGCAVFCDVSTDEGLFEGKGDFQFDVYRDMRIENGNDWQQFCPHSNVLWVNYICKKLTSFKYKDTGRNNRNAQRHLRSMVDTLLDYSCCVHIAEDLKLWVVPD